MSEKMNLDDLIGVLQKFAGSWRKSGKGTLHETGHDIRACGLEEAIQHIRNNRPALEAGMRGDSCLNDADRHQLEVVYDILARSDIPGSSTASLIKIIAKLEAWKQIALKMRIIYLM